MFKGRIFGSGGIWKSKNPHSLEYLKYLHGLLLKNETVTEQNRTLLVEAIRSISEILIWGDQNDTAVFDFFLEKNMLSFFLKIMNQKCGSYVCVQLLQTLNILFENISHETSVYYLLSNNHVNSIITHRFDFSDEEIMAYYISFLKTLSFKLNPNTVHFFFNEQTNDFPLYTEAIKFFNHPEGMVRIAVRTLTLNVWKVSDASMLKFIRDNTAAPYFSNLVWFIAKHIMEMDSYAASSTTDRKDSDMLNSLIAEHLDHIHYVNDILCLQIPSISEVLTEQLLGRLILPLYLSALCPQFHPSAFHVSPVMALFLLTQIFLILTHSPLVEKLVSILAFGSEEEFRRMEQEMKERVEQEESRNISAAETEGRQPMKPLAYPPSPFPSNSTDEEKLHISENPDDGTNPSVSRRRPFYAALLSSLNASGTDHASFFGLTLLYAVSRNEGITTDVLRNAELSGDLLSDQMALCDRQIVAALVKILRLSCEKDSRVRLITVDLCCLVIRQIIMTADTVPDYLQETLYSQLVAAKEDITGQLVQYYKNEELFLDLFEDEYQEFQKKNMRINMISTDPNMLLPPSATPMSGVQFVKRLPCGPQEDTRRAVRVYFEIRSLLLDLDGGTENRLPLSNPKEHVALDDCLNLMTGLMIIVDNSDLLSCTVHHKNGTKHQRFLVADGLQLILVEPDNKRLGWGVVRFVGFLQDVELSGDKEDSRVLCVTLHLNHRPSAQPLLNAKFIFDDHIRCMAAKQRLTKGRQKARQHKLELIADLLEIPPALRTLTVPTPSSTTSSSSGTNRSNASSPSSRPPPSYRWSGRGPGGVARASTSTGSGAHNRSGGGESVGDSSGGGRPGLVARTLESARRSLTPERHRRHKDISVTVTPKEKEAASASPTKSSGAAGSKPEKKRSSAGKKDKVGSKAGGADEALEAVEAEGIQMQDLSISAGGDDKDGDTKKKTLPKLEITGDDNDKDSSSLSLSTTSDSSSTSPSSPQQQITSQPQQSQQQSTFVQPGPTTNNQVPIQEL